MVKNIGSEKPGCYLTPTNYEGTSWLSFWNLLCLVYKVEEILVPISQMNV